MDKAALGNLEKLTFPIFEAFTWLIDQELQNAGRNESLFSRAGGRSGRGKVEGNQSVLQPGQELVAQVPEREGHRWCERVSFHARRCKALQLVLSFSKELE